MGIFWKVVGYSLKGSHIFPFVFFALWMGDCVFFRSPGDVYTKALRITIVYWDAPPPSNNGKERAKNRAGSPSRKKTCKQILVTHWHPGNGRFLQGNISGMCLFSLLGHDLFEHYFAQGWNKK